MTNRTDRQTAARRAPLLLCAAALVVGCSSSGSAPSSGASPPPAPAAPGDPLAEAGDIISVSGTDVFVLNQWKGLMIVSLADPTNPRLEAQVAIGGAGVPVEMFVVPGYVLALVRGVSDYLPCDACAVGVTALTDSQLVVIDVATPAAPAVVARVGVPGQVRDARLAGDVLYAVADNGKLVVTSTDVSNPAQPREVDRIDVDVDGAQTLLHMRDGALYVVSTDLNTAAIGECGAPGQADGCTFISAVDVSAPDGHLALGATYAMTGHMIDRDSIDLFQGTLRVIVRESSLVATHPAKLRTFQARTAAELEPLASLLLGDDVSQSLTAVRFDGARAFAVTSDQSAPLYTIDLGDPQQPQVVGHVTQPGTLDHLEIEGDQLIALGAAAGGAAGGARQLQLSLYDVSDLTAPRLLASAPFGSGDRSQILTGDADGLGSAFQIVDARGLVLVPYANVFESADWSYQRTEPHVQLATFTAATLALAGSIAHPGEVLRAVPFATTDVITLSQEALQVVDVGNALQPQILGRLELSRNVAAAAIATDGANAVALEVDPSSGAATLSEVPPDTLDVSAAGLATLPVSTLQAYLFLNGSLATLVSLRATSPSTMVELFDVSAPTTIARRGSALFDKALTADPNAVQSPFAPALAATRVVAAAGPSLVALVDQEIPYDAFTGPGGLTLVDLSNPDRPNVAGRLAFAGVRNIGIAAAAAGSLTIVTEEAAATSNSQDFVSAFFLHTVDVSTPGTPRVIKKVSLPGTLLAASSNLVLSEQQYNGALIVDSLSAAGDLTQIGTQPYLQNGTAAIEGMRVVLGDEASLEVADLSPGGDQSTTLLPGGQQVRVAGLAGGRAILATGEVYDVRAAVPRFVTLLPRDATDGPPDVRVELSSATNLPIRAYFAGGFRGIQALPLE